MATFKLVCSGTELDDEKDEIRLGTFTRPYLPHIGMDFVIMEPDHLCLRVDAIEDNLETGEVFVFVVPNVPKLELKQAWEAVKTYARALPKI